MIEDRERDADTARLGRGWLDQGIAITMHDDIIGRSGPAR